MRSHLYKLETLIKSGDPESITQALELAGVLFEKNSKEMKEVESYINEFLQKIADAIQELSHEGLSIHYDINEGFQLEIPYRLEVKLVYYGKFDWTKVFATISFDNNRDIAFYPIGYWEMPPVERVHYQMIERDARQYLPLSSEGLVKGFRDIEAQASKTSNALIKKLYKQTEKIFNKVMKAVLDNG